MNNRRIRKLIVVLSAIYFVVSIVCLLLSMNYINRNLLKSNQNMAVDIAKLVKNNFQITDAEVAYMKSLTFNEMEVAPINLRLMKIGNGAGLNLDITNVYLVAPLEEDEVKYVTDATNAEQFMCEPGTPLDAVWLLNGTINEQGEFVVTEREDIYRYTDITEEMQKGFTERVSYGTYSADEWGNFITGYVPVYTVEGKFAGLLGIDMNPDHYQKSVTNMTILQMVVFTISNTILIGLFLVYYFKYIKAQEQRIYFNFYSRMSHDMRTPMNGIMGMTKLAETEENVEVLHQYFQKIGESGEYLLHLINDTLDVSKISSGKMTLNKETVSFAEIFENIAEMVQLTALKRDIRFSVEQYNIDKKLYIYTDAVRLKQIFMNLLSNALKYTQAGGTVIFTEKCIWQDEKTIHCQFTVEDNGVGMSEDYLKNSLFKPFAQEHNAMSDQYTGSGLGLAIVKNLVTLMGGTISVSSYLGEGTTFVIEMDLQKAEPPEIETEVIRKPEDSQAADILKDKHILICEDHPLNAEIACKLLKKQGCEVDVAENGKIGVDAIANSPLYFYDAVLMDIRMPVLDGLEATRQIRLMNRQDTGTIPIIAMTANAYAEDMIHSKEAGMNEHLSKPIEPRKLYETLAYQIAINEKEHRRC